MKIVLFCLLIGVLKNSECADLTVFASDSGDHVVRQAEIDEPIVYSHIGQPANILCRSSETPPKPLDYCKWKIFPFESTENVTFNVTEKTPVVVGGRSYSYYGSGFTNGECGIHINNVTKDMIGLWDCILVEKDHFIFVGTVQLQLWERPQVPKILESNLKNITASTPNMPSSHLNNISCCANGGKPAPKLSLSFDGDLINTIETSTSIFNNDETIQNRTCILWKGAKFNSSSNGKALKCLAEHISFPKNEIVADTRILDIKFPPTITAHESEDRKKLLVPIPIDTTDFEFPIQFSGNPRPDIEWFIKADNNEMTLLLNSLGHDHEKFKLHTTQISRDTWESVLRVDSLQRIDIINSYVLKFINDYGKDEISVEFQDGTKGTINWLLILGFVGLAVFVVVSFAVLHYMSKRNGWLCYSGQYGTYPVSTTKPRKHVKYNSPHSAKNNASDSATEEAPTQPINISKIETDIE